VLEIGCGTAETWCWPPGYIGCAIFSGIDVSTEMLTSAMTAISRCGLTIEFAPRTAMEQGLTRNLFWHAVL